MPAPHADPPTDVVVIGGGSAGLALAAALARHNLAVTVIERTDTARLAAPPDDGREIQLTDRSVALLARLGAWSHVPPGRVVPMRAARVLNGSTRRALRLDPPTIPGSGKAALGRFVANAVLRRALFEAATASGARIVAGRTVVGTAIRDGRIRVALDDGTTIAARLAVAADGRLSPIRRAAGIGCAITRFGQRMVVCRMRHERPHGGVSTAWFDRGRILSILPLDGERCSAVLSLPEAEAAALLALDDATFSDRVTTLFGHALGRMRKDDAAHAAPVVTTYAERFAAARLVLLGDAAVGMHPVTAHGFNLGLTGADLLGGLVRDAAVAGRDPGGPSVTDRFARAYRRATWLPYQATTAIVRLYGDERWPSRVLRDIGLRTADAVPPLRRLIAAELAER